MSNNQEGFTRKDKIMVTLEIITIAISLLSIYINVTQTRKNLKLSEKLSYYQIPPTEILIGSPLQDNELEVGQTYSSVINVINNFNNYAIPVHCKLKDVLKDGKSIRAGYYSTSLIPREQQIKPLEEENFNFTVSFDEEGDYVLEFIFYYNYQQGKYLTGKSKSYNLMLFVE